MFTTSTSELVLLLVLQAFNVNAVWTFGCKLLNLQIYCIHHSDRSESFHLHAAAAGLVSRSFIGCLRMIV